MPVFIGYYRDKSGEIVTVSEVAFHQATGDEFVVVRPNTEEGVVSYPNKRLANHAFAKVIVVPRAIFDNEYTFMGEDWYPPGFMEDCVFS
jgi:hypothetical protein